MTENKKPWKVGIFQFPFKGSYSLLELLLVLAIMAILAGLGVPSAKVIVVRKYEVELRRNLKEVRYALDRYRDDQRARFGDPALASYPLTLDQLVLASDVLGGPFLQEIPKIPFYNTIHWEVRSSNRPYGGNDFDWLVLPASNTNPFGAGHRIMDIRFPKTLMAEGSFVQSIDGRFYHEW